MPMTTRMNVQCPRCGNLFEAMMSPLVDVGQEPDSKIRLLNGQWNAAQCPRCGNVSQIATPLLYHDPDKELLISFTPLGMNMPKPQQEKLIGDLIRDVTNRLPQEQRKGYLFRPREALTMQGLIDQVLQADGITPEMMEAQRAKMRLVEQLVQAQENELPALVQENDAQIDEQLFQVMGLMAQQMMQQGRPDVAQHVLNVQQRLVELSSVGQDLIARSQQQEQAVQDVANDIRALGQNAQRGDFLNLALGYAHDDEKLQALVGLARPAFDEGFFQELTMHVAQAPAGQRETLESLRERIAELTAMIDQQTQLALQDAAELLQVFISSPNLDALIRENVALIDDTFMAVLTANIQEAERQKDIQMSAKLKDVYNRVVTALRANMQPELRFINEVLSAPGEDEARTMIREQASTYGERLLDMIDAVEDIMASRGDQATLQRLNFIRAETEQVLG